MWGQGKGFADGHRQVCRLMGRVPQGSGAADSESGREWKDRPKGRGSRARNGRRTLPAHQYRCPVQMMEEGGFSDGKVRIVTANIYYCGQESLRRNRVALIVNKRVQNAVVGCNLKNDRMISVCFQGKPYHSNPSLCPNTNAKEAEVERFYEDLQDLERTPKKDVLFITGDWNAEVGSQEIPGVTGKFGLGVQNEAGQRLTEFCQENSLVIADTLFQQHKRQFYKWTSPDSQY